MSKFVRQQRDMAAGPTTRSVGGAVLHQVRPQSRRRSATLRVGNLSKQSTRSLVINCVADGKVFSVAEGAEIEPPGMYPKVEKSFMGHPSASSYLCESAALHQEPEKVLGY